MNELWWASWVLAAFGVATIFFAGRNKWWAWTIGILTETMWIGYSILTEQYGFIVAAIAYMIVYFRNTLKWKRSSTTDSILRVELSKAQIRIMNLENELKLRGINEKS